MATVKQKIAFDKTLENGGVVSSAMLEAGYTESMAKNPQKLTQSSGWKELMDTFISDNDLALKHNELLNSEREEIAIKALDMGYKLRGNYAPDKSINLNANVDIERNPKTQKIVEDFEERLKQSILE